MICVVLLIALSGVPAVSASEQPSEVSHEIDSLLVRVHALQDRLDDVVVLGTLDRRLDRLEGELNAAAAEGHLVARTKKEIEGTERLIDAWRQFRRGDIQAAAVGCGDILKRGDDDPDALDLMGMLSARRNETRAAASFLDKAYHLRYQKYGDTHPDVAWSLAHLAEAPSDAGGPDASIRQLQRAVEIMEDSLGRKDSEVLLALEPLGRFMMQRIDAHMTGDAKSTDCESAVRLIEEIVVLSDRFKDFKDYGTAESLLEGALQVARSSTGCDRVSLATVLNKRLALSVAQGDRGGAARRYAELFQEFSVRPAIGPLDVAQTFYDLGKLYMDLQEYTPAIRLFKQVIQLREAALGRDHPDLIQPHYDLGLTYELLKKYEDAEDCFKKVMACREKNLRPDHPDIAECLWLLAKAYKSQGKPRLAEDYFARSLRMIQKILGRESPLLYPKMRDLGNLYAETGQTDSAIVLLERALAICARTQGERYPGVALIANNLASSHIKKGNLSRAKALCRMSLLVVERSTDSFPDLVASALTNLGTIGLKEGNLPEAEKRIKDALPYWDKNDKTADIHLEKASALVTLGIVYERLGNKYMAAERYRQALEIYESVLGRAHPIVQDLMTTLEKMKH